MERDYQYEFSAKGTAMFNISARQKKAKTMIAVLEDYLHQDLNTLSVLNVGGSAGIIDEYLSRYFREVTGVDIDKNAIEYAKNTFKKDNLSFQLGDAMNLDYQPNTFDVVICSQVYEHVPNAKIMMKEIHRILKAGGVCYFAAGNRLMFNEPHYNLPLLSILPRPLAHLYLRATGKGSYYYEKHLSFWGLKKMVSSFEVYDYTKALVMNPEKFHTAYMLPPGSKKHKLALLMAKFAIWAMPGYIWLLKKSNSSKINSKK